MPGSPLLPLPPKKPGKVPSSLLEDRYRRRGYRVIAGVDEAGRGPLAGPVVAAAVVLPLPLPGNSPLRKVRDCKCLSPKARAELYEIIKEKALALAWAMCDHKEIDEMNILAASLEAMKRAVLSLPLKPELCLVDGKYPIPCPVPSVAVVKGDCVSVSIAAASIVAKVERDRIMDQLHQDFPQYNFKENKGYGTKDHKLALKKNGPSPVHRKTFRGVKELLPRE